MATFAPDTSCMVAKPVVTHEHHERAVAALDRHLNAGDSMVIVACARLAGVDVLLTFNERHFRRFEGDGLSIELP